MNDLITRQNFSKARNLHGVNEQLEKNFNDVSMSAIAPDYFLGMPSIRSAMILR